MARRLDFETIWYGLIYVAEEMGVALQRTAVSPNIRDRLDFSCAILDPDGRLVAQAEHIPVHLGTMAVSGPLIVDEIKRLYDVEPGDIYVTNNPYLSGTHLNDILVVKPVFYGDRLVAWLANKAHHVDVGGSVPGSIGGSASSLIEEGLIIPLTRLARRGELVTEVVKLIEVNSRTPELLRMDLHAQVAALTRGETLLKELIDRYSVSSLLDAMDQSISYVEEYIRKSLECCKGVASAEDYIETSKGLAKIKARVEITTGKAVVDYTGTSSQVNEPINAVYQVTVAATTYAIKAVIDPEMPINQGFYNVVSVIAPKGSLVNPEPPAPVGAYTETSQRIVDVVLKALASIAPGRVPAASCGSMTNVAIGGRGWAFYETIACGSGARPTGDGVDGVHVNMTNTLNTPIEVIEQLYPLRILRYELRADSGGLGKYRGGLGVVREYLVLEEARASIAGSRVATRPWGLEGGLPGQPARYLVVRRDGRVESLPAISSVMLEPGDRLVVETPGGGGYGNPCDRPRDLIEKDAMDEKISLRLVEEARRSCKEQS